MKIKKKLHQLNNNINETILKQGQSLFDSLCLQYCVAPTATTSKIGKNTLKRRLTVALSCILVAVIALSLVWILIPGQNNEILYDAKFETSEECTFDDVNAVISKYARLKTQSYHFVKAERTYDKLSGDTLYYVVTFDSNEKFLQGCLYFVVNKNYKFMEKFSHLTDVVADYHGYKMNSIHNSRTVNGFIDLEIYGRVTFDGLLVYFSYDEFFEETDPRQVLDEMLKIK